MSSLVSFGSSHKLLEAFTSSSSKSAAQPAQNAQEDKRNLSNAQQANAAKLLETSEEAFKASINAKNEEISKMTEMLRNLRGELAKEVKLVHKLNAQMVSMQEEMVEKDHSLAQANQRVADLEKESLEMKRHIELIMDGTIVKPHDGSEEIDATKTNGETIEALKQRSMLAERDVAVLNGLVEAMKQMIAIQWEQQNHKASNLQDKVHMLERNQAAWEAESNAAKDRVQVLERQLKGKDEIIASLRAQLQSRK